ncbi:hypothetical protein [Nocardia sp. NPDC057353]|uniref:hypothetical protein n=1 Tax=Nocardia sp. NPDC057353 TaxID=3346104 RepID=UPI0036257C14
MKTAMRAAMSAATAIGAAAVIGLGSAGEAAAGTYGGLGDPISCSNSTTLKSRGIYSGTKWLGTVELRIGNCPGGAGMWAKTVSAIGTTDLVANAGRTTNFYDQAHVDARSTAIYTRYLRYDYGRTQFCANGAIKDPARNIYLGDTICNK